MSDEHAAADACAAADWNQPLTHNGQVFLLRCSHLAHATCGSFQAEHAPCPACDAGTALGVV